jgi:diguanylate cyclase (GGDEF)-like protein
VQAEHIETTHRLKHKDGHWVWILGRGFIQYDENANPLRMVGIHTDISKNKEREALIQKQADSLYYLAHYDMLTGLANRVLLTDRLQQGIKKSTRYKTKLALFFIDINNFKTINDSFGHHMGDKVLKEIANRLKIAVREEDTIARFGGDEFIILLENIKNISLVKEKIKNTFKESIIVDSHAFNITCSIGVSIYPDDANTVDTLLKDADKKMYQDKENTQVSSPLE